jgi:predicted transcriptional regulator
MPKGNKDRHMMIRMDDAMFNELDEIAEKLSVSRTTVARMAIKQFLGEIKREKSVSVE